MYKQNINLPFLLIYFNKLMPKCNNRFKIPCCPNNGEMYPIFHTQEPKTKFRVSNKVNKHNK